MWPSDCHVLGAIRDCPATVCELNTRNSATPLHWITDMLVFPRAAEEAHFSAWYHSRTWVLTAVGFGSSAIAWLLFTIHMTFTWSGQRAFVCSVAPMVAMAGCVVVCRRLWRDPGYAIDELSVGRYYCVNMGALVFVFATPCVREFSRISPWAVVVLHSCALVSVEFRLVSALALHIVNISAGVLLYVAADSSLSVLLVVIEVVLPLTLKLLLESYFRVMFHRAFLVAGYESTIWNLFSSCWNQNYDMNTINRR